MLRLIRPGLVAGTAVAVCVAFAAPASADVPLDTTGDVVAALDNAPDLGQNATPAETGGTLTAQADGGVTVELPASGDGAVEVRAPGRPTLSLGLPIAAVTSAADITGDGTVVFGAAQPSGTGMAVNVLKDGAVSIQTVIADADAAHTFAYPVENNVTPILRPDGGVDLTVSVQGALVTVGEVRTPWAVDSNGNQVETHYVVSGTTITQVVEAGPDTAYPVVADPTYGHTYGIPTIYFNKAETRKAAGSADGVYVLCGAVSLVSPYLGFMCSANAYIINDGAKYAKDAGQCVKVLVGPLVVAADKYKGGNCK